MTTSTQGEHAQTEALRLAAGLESFSESLPAYGFNPQPLKDAAETIRRLHAQVAALTAAPAQPAAPQGVAYAELPDEEWIAERHAALKTFHTHEFTEGVLTLHPDCIDNALKEGLARGRASNGQAPAGAPTWEALHYAWQKIGADVAGLNWGAFTHAVHYAPQLTPTAKAAPAAGAVAGPVEWTPGPNVFKDWCSQWFGPDSDDEYLAKAVYALPPMAQRFAAAPTPATQADSVQGLQPVHDAVTIELLNERVAYLEGKLGEAVGLLEELAEHDSYSTEYDGRMVSICPECGEQDGEHRPNCAFVRAKAFLAARKQGGTHD